MKNKIIGTCPICGKELFVSELKCDHCGTKLDGEFILSPFDHLSKEQQNFALVFIKNGGNIKMIENELNISYPTVKKNLDDLINALGFDSSKVNITEKMNEDDIYKALKNNTISFDEAEKLLKEIKEND